MITNKMKISNIPVIVWGEKSDKVYLFVHGKMSSKESAQGFAKIAEEKGYQSISFDLPGHGERIDEHTRCDIWNGIRDLTAIGDYVFANWKEVSLYACSLGAYFSLHAYSTREFTKCPFQSPILDMECLIRKMMLWFDVSEERLFRKKEVDSPIDVLSREYYQYVKAYPIQKWETPTSILFGGLDDLQSIEDMETFIGKFGGRLTVAEKSEHPFMGDGDAQLVDRWLRENI